MIVDWNKHRHSSNDEKKKLLISWGQEFFNQNSNVPTQEDLAKIGVSYTQLRYLFKNLRNYHLACGLDSTIRKRNMSDDELREYLKSGAKIDPTNSSCPGFTQKGSICFNNCSCWIPQDRYVNEHRRSNIRHKDKFWLLHRLSYLLFIGPLEEDNAIVEGGEKKENVLHLCNNSLCYNPDHLKLGTLSENQQQKHEEGRHKHVAKSIPDHTLDDAYNFPELIKMVKDRCDITAKNEWLYRYSKKSNYPATSIKGKPYLLHRLLLANKLGKKYEEIKTARHLLPDGTEGQRHDLNPDHLVEGTSSQNAVDSCLTKAPLNRETILRIRDRAKIFIKNKGDAQKFDELMSKELKVSVNTVSNIRRGTSYAAYHDGQVANKPVSKIVIQYDLNGNIVREYASVAEAMQINGYTSNNMIYDVCKGISTSYKDFVWRYKT